MSRHWLTAYSTLYDLPDLSVQERGNIFSFAQPETMSPFVTVAVYDGQKRVFLRKDDSNARSLSAWKLLEGVSPLSSHFENTCRELVVEQIGADIDELEPIATITVATSEDSQERYGVAFFARLRDQRDRSAKSGLWFSDLPIGVSDLHRQIALLAASRLNRKRFIPPYDEIDAAQRLTPARLGFHSLVKKFVAPMSSRLLRARIMPYCGHANFVLDSACGDDTLIFELARHCELCVANDIAFRHLQGLEDHVGTGNIMLTSHNLLELPFRVRFDVVIFKNTIHHMHDSAELNYALMSLGNVARRLIILDVEDPYRSSLRSRIWNRYYSLLLKDRGGFFLVEEEFRSTILGAFPDALATFESIDTIKGKYMLAVVDLSIPPA